jgi:hypothetical protein
MGVQKFGLKIQREQGMRSMIDKISERNLYLCILTSFIGIDCMRNPIMQGKIHRFTAIWAQAKTTMKGAWKSNNKLSGMLK